MQYLALCVEGVKGGGKSTSIALLTEKLKAEGVTVEVFAPFVAVNKYAQSRGFPGAVQMINASKTANQEEVSFILTCIRDAEKAARERAIARAAAAGGGKTVFILDRGWMTIHPHLYGGRWYAEDKDDLKEIDSVWRSVLSEAPPTFFLHAAFDVVKKRRQNLDDISGLETDEKLHQDIEKRVRLAQSHPDKVVKMFDTGVTPQPEVVDSMHAYITSRWGSVPQLQASSRKGRLMELVL
jgi:thymidylate kinase